MLAWNPQIAKSFAWGSFCAKVHGYLGISVVWIKVMKARAPTNSFFKTFPRLAVLVTWILFVFHYLFIYLQRNLQLPIMLSNGKDLALCRTFFRGIDGAITSSLKEQFTMQVTVFNLAYQHIFERHWLFFQVGCSKHPTKQPWEGCDLPSGEPAQVKLTS